MDLQVRILGFPRVKRSFADTVFANNVHYGLPASLLLKDSADLHFAESALFHKRGIEGEKITSFSPSIGFRSRKAYMSIAPLVKKPGEKDVWL